MASGPRKSESAGQMDQPRTWRYLMRTGSLAGRLGRLRTLAVGGAVLGSLVAGGSALTATAAAATMDSNPASCGSTTSFFPQGDVLWMTDPSSGLQYVVAADAITTDSGP